MAAKVVYVLVSREEDCFYEMFLLSLCSLRIHNPDLEVEVVLDADSYWRVVKNDDPMLSGIRLTKVDVPEEYDGRQRSRYLKTRLRSLVEGDFLYLDTDTVVCGDLSGIGSLATDLAAVSDGNGPLRLKNRYAEVICRKAGFQGHKRDPFFNGGVFLVRDSEVSRRFFDVWHSRWLESVGNGVVLDQPAFFQANIDLGYPVRELPGEWNCQVCSEVGPYFFDDARIIHYYASYSSFQDTVVRGHIKEKEGMDEVAAGIASDPRKEGIRLYHNSYKGALTKLYSRVMFRLTGHPWAFAAARELTSLCSRPFSWFLARRRA